MDSGGMIYTPSFMTIGSDIQVILSLLSQQFFSCSVSISTGRDLWSTPLRWFHVTGYTYQVSWKLVQELKQYLDLASENWASVMLVLQIGRIYESRLWDWLRWHDIRTKFNKDWFNHSSNIMVLPQQFERLRYWSYWWEWFLKCAIEID
jgi:hypothetical protein